MNFINMWLTGFIAISENEWVGLILGLLKWLINHFGNV